MSISIVNDALRYYDRNNDIYRNVKRKIKYAKHANVDQNDIEGVKLVFYDENKEELFTSRVEVLAKYYNTISTWIWSWSLGTLDKSLTSIIRKVFYYGTDINITNKNPENILLKNELLTSRFRITDEAQIDIHCAIASYLAKKPFIFLWKDFFINVGEMAKVKGEDSKEKAKVSYYVFIVDPPNVEN
jgi:hypothetical protein